MKWGESKRDFDAILAVWPRRHLLTDAWWMQEFFEGAGGVARWRNRRVPTESGQVRADIYGDQVSAKASASTLNAQYAMELDARAMDPSAKTSLQLKVKKALQAKERLESEEGLMLSEAKRRNASIREPAKTGLNLHPESERYREELIAKLQAMPYLRVVLVGQPRHVVYLGHEGSWSKPYNPTQRGAGAAMRAEIANGFGFSATAHWGRTKAAIRKLLLPRANQLLQLASVQRMLAEALARGEKVLVAGAYVFWYEEDGSIGWQVKSTHAARGSEGATIWNEGTIYSANHGRLVILPYIKEDGEHVRGHTRNAPGDGAAKPRHPDHYVEIPFRQIDGDLMIGLFGELPYE